MRREFSIELKTVKMRIFLFPFRQIICAAIEELNEAVLNRLISRIQIGEVKKVDGKKVQEDKA